MNSALHILQGAIIIAILVVVVALLVGAAIEVFSHGYRDDD